MNTLENKMVQSLQDLKEKHGVVGVKAEFEAEGTRLDEALRLKEVVTKAGLDLTIKIGGCEALKDMFDARSIGVSHIVGPMVESSYALKKYLDATKIGFPEDERVAVKFLINIETITSFNNRIDILKDAYSNGLTGVVLGRVDMTGSLNLNRDVNHSRIKEMAVTLFRHCRESNLECVMGGGINKDSLPFINQLVDEHLLDRFETRKIIFNCNKSLTLNPEKGILKAVGFELMWLKNKCNFYNLILNEDKTRLEMLEKRYNKLIEEAGGLYE